jgi:hypothetical protein
MVSPAVALDNQSIGAYISPQSRAEQYHLLSRCPFQGMSGDSLAVRRMPVGVLHAKNECHFTVPRWSRKRARGR